jgi:DNA-directed RNA polymerase subunit beta
MELIPERLRGDVAAFDIKVGRKVIVEQGRRITARHIRELESAGVTDLPVPAEYLHGRALAQNVVDENSGEVLVECNTEISEEVLARLAETGVGSIETLYTNELDCGPFISNTLRGRDAQRTRGAGRNLPHDAPGRAADQGVRGEPVPEPVLLGGPL